MAALLSGPGVSPTVLQLSLFAIRLLFGFAAALNPPGKRKPLSAGAAFLIALIFAAFLLMIPMFYGLLIALTLGTMFLVRWCQLGLFISIAILWTIYIGSWAIYLFIRETSPGLTAVIGIALAAVYSGLLYLFRQRERSEQ